MARANVREQILEAAALAVRERGFNGVGVQEITDAAGVPKGSFYNHFASKEALGAELVERYGVNSTRRAVLRDRALPGLERLQQYFTAMFDLFIANNFERGCILGNLSAEQSSQSAMIRESLAGLYDRWTADLALAIGDAQASGTITNPTPATQLGAFVLDAFEGALLRARVERTREPLDRFAELTFHRILT